MVIGFVPQERAYLTAGALSFVSAIFLTIGLSVYNIIINRAGASVNDLLVGSSGRTALGLVVNSGGALVSLALLAKGATKLTGLSRSRSCGLPTPLSWPRSYRTSGQACLAASMGEDRRLTRSLRRTLRVGSENFCTCTISSIWLRWPSFEYFSAEGRRVEEAPREGTANWRGQHPPRARWSLPSFTRTDRKSVV